MMIRGVEIIPTYRCNLKCKFCYNKNHLYNEKEITLEEIKNIIKQVNIPLLRLFKLPYFVLVGGELFIREDALEILETICKTNLCCISTNGTLLNEKICKRLVDIKLHTIIFSIDGIGKTNDKIRGKGVFNKIVKNVKLLRSIREKHPKIIFNTTVTKENLEDVPKIIELGKKLKIDKIQLGALVSLNKRYTEFDIKETDLYKMNAPNRINPESMMKVFKDVRGVDANNLKIRFAPPCSEAEMIDWYNLKFNIKNWKCDYPMRVLRINPYGYVYPCLNMEMGNIRKEPINNIWNSGKFKNFRNRIKKGIVPACAMCCNSELK